MAKSDKAPAVDKMTGRDIPVRAVRPAGNIEDFFHALDGKVKLEKPLTIEEMNEIAAAGWGAELDDPAG